jgi:MFS family permease
MLTISSSIKTSITLVMLMGFAYSALLPAWNATLSYHVPENQEGLGWGIFSSVEGIGVMLGPVIGGWVADWHSEYYTVMVSAIMLGVIALFYFLFPFNRLIGGDPQ